ncbi:MAG TPA: hypothetical protein VGD98_15090 [Ktedonobacteraceae bacterium]
MADKNTILSGEELTRVCLWTLLVAAMLFLLGNSTALAATAPPRPQPTNTPAQVLQQYCDGYKTQNAQQIYNTISSVSQKRTSLTKIQESFNIFTQVYGDVKIDTCTTRNIQQKNSNATGNIKAIVDVSKYGFSSSFPLEYSMGLVLENGAWKIDISQMHYVSQDTDDLFSFLQPLVSLQQF